MLTDASINEALKLEKLFMLSGEDGLFQLKQYPYIGEHG